MYICWLAKEIIDSLDLDDSIEDEKLLETYDAEVSEETIENLDQDNPIEGNGLNDGNEECRDSNTEIPTYTQEDLNKLENIENFRSSAIEHIFNGEINRRGQAVGYHYEGIEESPGNIIEGTKNEPDKNGVYIASVEVDGIAKSGNGGMSTFYPDNMSPQEVIDAINEAYDNRVNTRCNTYVGESENGLGITMYLDANDKIISAFPIYEGDE